MLCRNFLLPTGNCALNVSDYLNNAQQREPQIFWLPKFGRVHKAFLTTLVRFAVVKIHKRWVVHDLLGNLTCSDVSRCYAEQLAAVGK